MINLIKKGNGTKLEKKKSYKRNNKIKSKENIIISKANFQIIILIRILLIFTLSIKKFISEQIISITIGTSENAYKIYYYKNYRYCNYWCDYDPFPSKIHYCDKEIYLSKPYYYYENW